MFETTLNKYYAVKYSVKLRPNENFGIIVSDSWNHTFLVIKHVLPNSKAQMLGIKPKDRICMVDNECHPQLNSKKLDEIFKSKLTFLMTVLRKRGSYKGYEIPEPMDDGRNNLQVNNAAFASINQLGQKRVINCYRDPSQCEDNQMEDVDDADSWNVSSTCGSFQDHLDLERHNEINNRQNSHIYNATFQCPNIEANHVDQWLQHNKTICHNQIMSESFQENKENYQPLRMMSGHGDLRGMYAQNPDNIKHHCCNKSEVKNRMFKDK